MTDYTKTTNFTAKDNLTTGDPLKVIKGAYFDTEFDNIATAITSKYDSDNLASQAQAEAETVNTVLMTPLRVAQWADYNAGILGDLQAIASNDGNGDAILFLDDTDDTAKLLTIGDGIEISGTTLQLPSALAGAGLTIGSGILAVGAGNGITVNANDVALASSAAGSGLSYSSGVLDLDIDSLTNIEGNALAATDTFLVADGATHKGIHYQDMGLRIQSSQATQTLAASDMNTIMEFNGTATVTLPLNSSVALPVGSFIIVVVDHATQEVTVDAAASVTLNSVFHPGGTASASDVVLSGGTAVVIKTATNEWYISGDIKDA